MADCIELYNVIIIIAVILWVEQVPQHPSPPSFKHCSWQICSAFFSVFLGQIFHFKCWLMFNEFPFNKLSFWVLWSFHSTISLITFSSTSACTSLFVLSFSTTPRDDSFQFTSPSFLVIYLKVVLISDIYLSLHVPLCWCLYLGCCVIFPSFPLFYSLLNSIYVAVSFVICHQHSVCCHRQQQSVVCRLSVLLHSPRIVILQPNKWQIITFSPLLPPNFFTSAIAFRPTIWLINNSPYLAK